jgi:lysophospholipase L1-like esterase
MRRVQAAAALLGALLGALVLAGCGAAAAPVAGAPTAGAHPNATASPSPAAGTIRIAGLGDSVMAGTRCVCAGPVSEYGDALAAKTGRRVSVSDLGVNGSITTDLLQDLRTDARTRNAVRTATVVLVTIGANDLVPEFSAYRNRSCTGDCYTGAARVMGRHLVQVLDAIVALRHASTRTVLVTGYWNVFTDGAVARADGGQDELDWNAAVTAVANTEIRRAAAATGMTYVDLVGPFKGDGTRDPSPLLARDGDHPNAAGVRAMVRALVAATPPLS